MKKSMIALAVLMSLSSLAQASTQACDGSTAEMKECIGAQIDVADKELNKTYRQALIVTKQFDVEAQGRLIAAEKAWIAFRDASCSLESAQMLGGTGEGVIAAGCFLRMTLTRTQELKQIVKDFSGN
jgi:uncharacterized protein YecT (DUF1311 family)